MAATTYRVIAAGVRFYRPGEGEIEAMRPYDEKRDTFLDSDGEPTLITIKDGDPVDVAALLATGALAEYAPRAASAKARRRR